MNYLITEPLVRGGLSGHRSRSKIISIKKSDDVPEGATPTEEPVRDWQVDEAPASPTEGN